MQPAAETVAENEPAESQPAAVHSEPLGPVSNTNFPPQPTLNLVTSSPETSDKRASDVVRDVSDEPVASRSVTAKEPSPAMETVELASSPPSQSRSAKRATQRATKPSHKSSSVSCLTFTAVLCLF